jgi:4-hydroxy-2-oxoheptanedioate aldolase
MAATDTVATLAQRLAAGDTIFMSWCGMVDPIVPGLLAAEGFDACLLDMQHGAVDVAAALAGVSAVAAAGKPALVRVPVGDFATASRMLDGGAAAIVAPMINSVADARTFADFTKFPPLGRRSWGPHRALTLSGRTAAAYLKEANAFHLAIAMIETREALDALDDILAVPGIDGVLVGPSDLSITLTHGATVDAAHPLVDAALDHIAARAAAHGKIASAFTIDGARAKTLAGRGYRLLSIATDQLLLRSGARAELAVARGT